MIQNIYKKSSVQNKTQTWLKCINIDVKYDKIHWVLSNKLFIKENIKVKFGICYNFLLMFYISRQFVKKFGPMFCGSAAASSKCESISVNNGQ